MIEKNKAVKKNLHLTKIPAKNSVRKPKLDLYPLRTTTSIAEDVILMTNNNFKPDSHSNPDRHDNQ